MGYEKLIKDGKVAVLYSPGFGAGISTWSGSNREALTFDKELVELVLKGDKKGAFYLFKSKYPEEYAGGLKDAEIEWVPQGTAFRIKEYDGSESVEIIKEISYLIA